MPLSSAQIQERALAILEQEHDGIRHEQLAAKILTSAPDTNKNTIRAALSGHPELNRKIQRPSRGLWILDKYAKLQAKEQSLDDELPARKLGREKAFYEPFAQWLKEDREEVNHVLPIGGNMWRDKWATPDVIGTHKPTRDDPYEFQLELVSAEIKTDGGQCVTAFGHACAYRLFSHKTYIAVPTSVGQSDLDRLNALCALDGMGLVLFELNPEQPEFQLRLPAARFEPDKFYVNEFARRLRDNDKAAFTSLFG